MKDCTVNLINGLFLYDITRIIAQNNIVKYLLSKFQFSICVLKFGVWCK